MPTPPRRRFELVPRGRRELARAGVRVGVTLAVILVGVVAVGCWMTSMPARSFRGALPAGEPALAATATRLCADVQTLAAEIGERNTTYPKALERAASHVERALTDAGWTPKREPFRAVGETVVNVIAERRGARDPGEIVLIGAHYDSAPGTPGADDNASGAAVLLELARAFSGKPVARTLRLVGFVNEEPPFFQTEEMGSLVHAKGCRARGENVVAMLALETMGYYADVDGSQHYPPPLSLVYPSRGDFIAFVGDVGSRGLVREVVRSFRAEASFPSEGAALPGWLPGIGWSDHWSFWQAGYAGVMVTDTAPFRLPHYHASTDHADVIDYDRLARVTRGLVAVVDKLTR